MPPGLDWRGLESRAQREGLANGRAGSFWARSLRTTSSKRAPNTIARIGPNLLERRNSIDAPDSAAIKRVDWRVCMVTFLYLSNLLSGRIDDFDRFPCAVEQLSLDDNTATRPACQDCLPFGCADGLGERVVHARRATVGCSFRHSNRPSSLWRMRNTRCGIVLAVTRNLRLETCLVPWWWTESKRNVPIEPDGDRFCPRVVKPLRGREHFA